MSDIESLASTLRSTARAANQRRLLVLSGRREWCRSEGGRVLRAWAAASVVWVSDQGPADVDTVPADRCHAFLGREFDLAVLDAWAGFDPDALGALSGAIRGGGLLLLLCPPMEQWPGYVDPEHRRIAVAPYGPEAVTGRFLGRIVRELLADPDVTLIREDEPLPQTPAPVRAGSAAVPAERGAEQALAVEAIEHVATGHRRRPLVLTSDRGRGKSAALGMAAGHLMRRGISRILVTAPRAQAAEQVFLHAARLLPEAESGRYEVTLGGAELRFVAPDELVRYRPAADLLLVDEAAAIPSPLLETLLGAYSRIVFSTTVHGYEGTGRGFAVRFQQVLDRETPDWRAFRLQQPIRWAVDDPVERFVFRALLLDAAPAPSEQVAAAAADTCTLEKLDRDALAGEEGALRELFGLLVLAHYRTRPLDLRHLLDGPNVGVWAMRYRGRLVGTALVAREGGFGAGLAHAIWTGRRRPRGHLIAQSLAAHIGLEDGPMRLGDRIMRIAVHPAVQGRGLGSRLVEAVTAGAQADGLDYVGTSFGATASLIGFWRRLNFSPVRVGLSREASSGTHSVMMLRGLTPAGHAIVDSAGGRFGRQFVHLLSDALRNLEPDMALRLLQMRSPVPPALAPEDWRDVAAVAYANRGYESALLPVWSLVCAVATNPGFIGSADPTARTVLVARVLQRRQWHEVAALAGLRGRKQAVEALRRALRPLVECYAPEGARTGLQDSGPRP